MSLPPTFTTKSLGELSLQDDKGGYRPGNQNQHRFLFEPGNNLDPASWITLIDQRAPQLNSRWPDILASAPEQLKASLATIGQSFLSNEAGLEHITINGAGEAVLVIRLAESNPENEAAPTLTATVNEQGLVTTINLTR